MLVAAMSPLDPTPATRRYIFLFFFAFFAFSGALGCGHPATADECRLIVDRIAELELRAQNVTDPAEIARRRRTSLGLGDSDSVPPDRLQECVGRHVTDRAMACVRSARTADEITERCLR